MAWRVGTEDAEFIKQAATFFGPNDLWREWLDPAKARPLPRRNGTRVPNHADRIKSVVGETLGVKRIGASVPAAVAALTKGAEGA